MTCGLCAESTVLDMRCQGCGAWNVSGGGPYLPMWDIDAQRLNEAELALDDIQAYQDRLYSEGVYG